MNSEVMLITLHDREVEITVTTSRERVCQWLRRQRAESAFGVDVEWRPNFARGEDNQVSLLQIGARNKSLLIQLMYIDFVPDVSDEHTLRGALRGISDALTFLS